jgi:DNA-binding NtrC family response regulator
MSRLALDRRVLVVEDDAGVARTVTDILVDSGYTVVCTRSAEDARRILARETFDVAVIDCVMPGEGGFSLASFVGGLNIRIVMMSGEVSALVKLRQTHSCFLSKPFRMGELLRVIQEAIVHVDQTTEP